MPPGFLSIEFHTLFSKDEATQKEAEAKHIQTYNTSKMDMEKLNFDREEAKLKPQLSRLLKNGNWPTISLPRPRGPRRPSQAPKRMSWQESFTLFLFDLFRQECQKSSRRVMIAILAFPLSDLPLYFPCTP